MSENKFTTTMLNDQTQSWIQAVEGQTNHPVTIEFADKKAGYLRHDQAQLVLRDGAVHVKVFDITEPNYTVAHELLHFLLVVRNVPQVAFNLTTGKQDLDLKLMTVGVELYDSVLHFAVYRDQRNRGLITEEDEELYFKGILATLQPEPADGHNDGWMSFRLLTLFDALIFFVEQQEAILPKLQELYPKTLQAAQKLYELASAKPLVDAHAMRRTVVKLYKAFDQQLERWGLVSMYLTDFVTLTPVLSDRQLRLEVRQLFTIYHSEWTAKLHHRSGYIGRWKNDEQNSFVIPEPQKNAPETFTRLYEMKVADFMERMGLEYLKK